MDLLRETFGVLLVGVLLGIGAGLIVGFPRVGPSPAEGEACLAPELEQPELRWISSKQARELLDDEGVQFVDARPREQFYTGHVAGSLSVPVDDGSLPEQALEVLQRAQVVVTYCDGECARSARLASMLASRGFHDVRVLEGGMPAWLERGYPAEAGTCRLCP